jgi:hypothetical protein
LKWCQAVNKVYPTNALRDLIPQRFFHFSSASQKTTRVSNTQHSESDKIAYHYRMKATSLALLIRFTVRSMPKT